MITIDDYINAAREMRGFLSDNQLSKALGFKSSAVNHWRTKRAWPGDDTMIRLAEMAGIDPDLALIHLNAWRSRGEAKSRYSGLADRMTARRTDRGQSNASINGHCILCKIGKSPTIPANYHLSLSKNKLLRLPAKMISRGYVNRLSLQ